MEAACDSVQQLLNLSLSRLDMRLGAGCVGDSLGARVSIGCSDTDRSPDTIVAEAALLLQRKVCAVEALPTTFLQMH